MTTDLSTTARAVLRALATLTAYDVDVLDEYAIMRITGLDDVHVVYDCLAELIDAGMIAAIPGAPADRLTPYARALLLTLAMSPHGLTAGTLTAAIAELTTARSDDDMPATVIDRAEDAGLIDDHSGPDDQGDYYVSETGMVALERDIRAGVIDTDPAALRVATMHMTQLIATADHHGQPLAQVIADTMTTTS